MKDHLATGSAGRAGTAQFPISFSPRCIRPASRPPPCTDWSSGFTHFPLFIGTGSPFIKAKSALIYETKNIGENFPRD